MRPTFGSTATQPMIEQQTLEGQAAVIVSIGCAGLSELRRLWQQQLSADASAASGRCILFNCFPKHSS